MARIYLNNVRTRLAAALSAAGTTCNVMAGDGAQFAEATGGNTIRATLVKISGYKEVDWEIVDITAQSTDALTITRALEGTTALDFEIGDVLDVRFTAMLFDSVVVSGRPSELPAPPTGTILHLASADGVATFETLDAFGASAGIIGRRANGTLAAKTALLTNQFITQFSAMGYGATGYSASYPLLVARTAEGWSDSANGIVVSLQVVKNGTATTRRAVDVNHNGLLKPLYGVGFGVVPTTSATYTVLETDSSLIANYAGTSTYALPDAASWPGKIITVKTVTNNAVVSASSNVVPLVGGAAGTAILGATAGKWADLQSDGTNWVVMRGN